MKKTLIALLTFVLLGVAVAPVMAEDAPFATAYDLYCYWEENDAYPDYVSGVWSTDGGITNLTFSVLDTAEGNAGKDEILALIENDRTVSFAYGVNSYNRLKDIMDSLMPFFESGRGLVHGGVDVYTGKINLGILEDRQNDPETLAMLEEMYEAFGRDTFTVVYTGEITHTLIGEIAPDDVVTLREPRAWFGYALAGVLVLTLTAVLVVKARRTSALITNTGETVSADARPTVRDTERAVKDAVVQAPAALDEKVFDAIEQR